MMAIITITFVNSSQQWLGLFTLAHKTST